MLDTDTKEEIKAKLYPAADDAVLGPVKTALEHSLRPRSRVLDAGCGEGTWILRDYQSKIDLLVGTDINAPKEKNTREFVVSELESLPFSNAVFDIIICYYVIEHLRHPHKVFTEFRRVLTDGGVLIIKTPCIAAPMFILSHHTSLRWHQAFKNTIMGVQESEVFPTYYRCNTMKKLDRTLVAAGFRREQLESVEQMYSYFSFNRVSYAAGLLISRMIQALPWMRSFRSQIIGTYRKL